MRALLSCLSDTANEGSLKLGSWPCFAVAEAWAYWLFLGFCFGGGNFLNLPRKMSQSVPNLRTLHKTSINPTMPTQRSKCTQKSQTSAKIGVYECHRGRSSSVLHRSCAAAKADAGFWGCCVKRKLIFRFFSSHDKEGLGAEMGWKSQPLISWTGTICRLEQDSFSISQLDSTGC